jgi:HSP20 family protein
MDASEEKFFETLAGSASNAGDHYEVELAKAQTNAAAVAKPKAAEPKIIEPDEMDEKWDDGEPEGKLMVDVYQTPAEIVVESAIAGAKPENIDISATADSITIRGSRKREKAVHDESYLYQECYWGKFTRSIILPQEVDPDSATVTFKNGILTVRLPKINRKKTKKLQVKME